MIRIVITQAAYRAIRASLPPNATTDSDLEGATVRVWLDPTTVDRLSAMRSPGEDISDVILRLARLEERPTQRPEPDQIEELVRILSEDGQTPSDGPLPRGPRPKDHSRRKLTPRR
jgi:hypothetical protein